MDRRQFLKLGSLTGLSLALPWGFASNANAQALTWGGPYFLHLQANGGWDPTLFCDAKLAAAGYDNALTKEVSLVNGIPVPVAAADGKFFLRRGGAAVEDPKHFFETAGSPFVVFNGVDTQTNGHEPGQQSASCGDQDKELPCLAALFAGKVSAERKLPLSFLANGDYNRTGDIVAASRFPGAYIASIASPYLTGPARTISDATARRIAQTRQERLVALQAQATLPRNRRTLSAFDEASRGGAAIGLISQIVSDPLPAFASFEKDLPAESLAYQSVDAGGGISRFVAMNRDLEQILQSFRLGVAASATYVRGGFDTHGDHDRLQTDALAGFVSSIRYVMLRAKQLGIANKLFVVVTSDFGRTPQYNATNGKDHWNVTSTLVAGPGIRGGRVIGKTDAGHRALRLVPSDINKTVVDTDTSGKRLHPSHIHRELRRVMGVDTAPSSKPFPLPSGEEHGALALLT